MNQAALDRKLTTLNLGASYDFGVVKLFGELSQVKDKNETIANLALQFTNRTTNKYNGSLLGITAPLGSGLVRASYSRAKFDNGVVNGGVLANPFFNTSNFDSTANQLAIGYVYNLSERTALYATVSKLKISDGQNSQVLGCMAVIQTNGTNPNAAPGSSTTVPGASYTNRSSMGYDFGIRHSF